MKGHRKHGPELIVGGGGMPEKKKTLKANIKLIKLMENSS